MTKEITWNQVLTDTLKDFDEANAEGKRDMFEEAFCNSVEIGDLNLTLQKRVAELETKCAQLRHACELAYAHLEECQDQDEDHATRGADAMQAIETALAKICQCGHGQNEHTEFVGCIHFLGKERGLKLKPGSGFCKCEKFEEVKP